MATRTQDERRKYNSVTSYLPPELKQRAMRLAESDPRLSVSRIIEESLERYLPQLERKVGKTKEV